jgi:hypothetical protein
LAIWHGKLLQREIQRLQNVRIYITLTVCVAAGFGRRILVGV